MNINKSESLNALLSAELDNGWIHLSNFLFNFPILKNSSNGVKNQENFRFSENVLFKNQKFDSLQHKRMSVGSAS